MTKHLHRDLSTTNQKNRPFGLLRKKHTADLARVINAIRGQAVDILNGGSIRMRDMIDVVNHIRRYPNLFPEWHASETAKLFSPPIFKNKKEARGYFF